MPNRSEWEKLQQQYKEACETFLSEPDSDDDVQIISGDEEKSQSSQVEKPVIVESNVGTEVVSVEPNAETSSSEAIKSEEVMGETLSSLQGDEPSIFAEKTIPVADKEVAAGGGDESAMPIVILLQQS